MNAVYSILFVQALMGAFDNLWHHELQAGLPGRRSARRELQLHAAREAIYGVVFLGLAWLQWEGTWALLLAGLLAIEFAITCADFLEEDRSRRLPPLERVLHTALAVSYGGLLGLLGPVLLRWFFEPTRLVPVHHGAVSWFFTFSGVGVLAWSVRNAIAAGRLRRLAESPAVRRDDGPAVLVTGGTGFIGSPLVRSLVADGRRVIVLTRDVMLTRARFGETVWALDRLDDIPAETRIESVVHLAGAQVLGLPWTRRRRATLLASRTGIMRDLLFLMRRLHETPRVLVAASAVGFYGVPTPEAVVDESAPPQPGRFQSALCAAAEHEARRAESLGVRVVRMRFGIVLGRDGGAYPPMALAARLGLGARIGDGEQPVPWLHWADAIALLRHALADARMRGPVNAVAPEAVTQNRFAGEMAESYGRRRRVRVPAWLLRLAMGEMAELLTCGQRTAPSAALEAGFQFGFASLGKAMADLAEGPRDAGQAQVISRRRNPE